MWIMFTFDFTNNNKLDKSNVLYCLQRKKMTCYCKFQILIKLACFQYRNPNVSKVLHIHFVTFLTHGTNKKIKYQKT